MHILEKLPQIIKESRYNYETYCRFQKYEVLEVQERIDFSKTSGIKNQLVQGDNLEYMKHLLNKGMEGKINLIYIDPPFFSKNDYKVNIKRKSVNEEIIPVMEQIAYKDTWKEGMESYLKMLCTRLFYMKALLSETGSIFIHLDRHSVHYIKVLMDEIFGKDRFVNEIIWSYKSGGVSKRCFARKHDNILFYSKSKVYYFNNLKEKSYNRNFKPYRFKGVDEYQDENGWYTLVGMKDVWYLDMVGRTSGERVGYATQKPEALLERIISACSKEGDICADFFGGSGTLASVATKLNRKWLVCDIGKSACIVTHKRMAQKNVSYDMCKIGSDDEIETFVEFDIVEADDEEKLHISFSKYGYIDYKETPVSPKYYNVLRSLIEEDSLKLIEYWSIDMNYNGDEFIPSWISCRECEEVLTDIFLDYSGQKHVAIRILDIFGIETFVELDLKT